MSRMDSNARSGGTYRVNTYYFKIIFFSAPFSFTAQIPKETNKNVVHPYPEHTLPSNLQYRELPKRFEFFFSSSFFFLLSKWKKNSHLWNKMIIIPFECCQRHTPHPSLSLWLSISLFIFRFDRDFKKFGFTFFSSSIVWKSHVNEVSISVCFFFILPFYFFLWTKKKRKKEKKNPVAVSPHGEEVCKVSSTLVQFSCVHILIIFICFSHFFFLLSLPLYQTGVWNHVLGTFFLWNLPVDI